MSRPVQGLNTERLSTCEEKDALQGKTGPACQRRGEAGPPLCSCRSWAPSMLLRTARPFVSDRRIKTGGGRLLETMRVLKPPPPLPSGGTIWAGEPPRPCRLCSSAPYWRQRRLNAASK